MAKDNTKDLCEQLKTLMTQFASEESEKKPSVALQCQPVYIMPVCCPNESSSSESEEEIIKDYSIAFSNYYNNYNKDYRKKHNKKRNKLLLDERGQKAYENGITVGGLNPSCCEDRSKSIKFKKPTKKNVHTKAIISKDQNVKGAFICNAQQIMQKPSSGVKGSPEEKPKTKGFWKVEVDPTLPPCKYGEPCKAHCYNHPPDMKAINF